jgi:hypothetical protein
VRDWRIYGVVLLWAPVVSAWQTANLTLLLGLGIAGAWRARDHPATVGGIVALLVTVKLFVWPLGIWLLATRRYAGLAWAVATGIVLNVVAWAIIGFDQISAYQSLSRDITRQEESRSYNLLRLALDHGAGRSVAYALQLLAAAVVVLFCVRLGRRGADRSALTLSIAATLLAAPVIWLHYFALLVVALGVSHPRLSPIWLLPIALFACPVREPATLELLGALVVAAAVVVAALAARAPAEWIGPTPAFRRVRNDPDRV